MKKILLILLLGNINLLNCAVSSEIDVELEDIELEKHALEEDLKLNKEEAVAYQEYKSEYENIKKDTSELIGQSLQGINSLSDMIYEYMVEFISYEQWCKQWYENDKKLIEAVNLNDIKVAKELLESKRVHVNIRDNEGHTLLMKAFNNENKGMISLLIDNNVDVDAIHTCGETVLMCACCAHNKEIVELLIKAGADVNIISTTPSKMTALKYAAEKHRDEIVDLLLEAGAIIDDTIFFNQDVLKYVKKRASRINNRNSRRKN